MPNKTVTTVLTNQADPAQSTGDQGRDKAENSDQEKKDVDKSWEEEDTEEEPFAVAEPGTARPTRGTLCP